MTILGRSGDHVVDRHVASEHRNRRLRQLARATEPTLHGAQQRLVATMLERDAHADQMRGERSAGGDVRAVLDGVAVDDEPPIRRELGVVEALDTEGLEPLLATLGRRGTGCAALGAASTRRTPRAAR